MWLRYAAVPNGSEIALGDVAALELDTDEIPEEIKRLGCGRQPVSGRVTPG